MTSHSEISASAVRGTLNVLMSNRNGVILAADSRGTFTDAAGRVTARRDHFQKLFRTGARCAATIAGLLAYPPMPYEFETIGMFRAKYGIDGIPDSRGDPFIVLNWVQHRLGTDLRCLSAILSTQGIHPQSLRLSSLVAGYDGTGKLHAAKVEFMPPPVPQAINGRSIWLVSPNIATAQDTSKFLYVATGMPATADAICSGQYLPAHPAASEYNRARNANALDELPLQVMVELVRLIFDETIAAEVDVGGGIQMAVIPAEGDPVWALRMASVPPLILGGVELLIGGRISDPSSANNQPHFEMAHSFDSFAVKAVFVATHFENIAIPLDRNMYYGNSFTRCTFKFRGSPTVIFANNDVHDCALDIASTSGNSPAEIQALRAICRPAGGDDLGRKELPGSDWQLSSTNGTKR